MLDDFISTAGAIIGAASFQVEKYSAAVCAVICAACTLVRLIRELVVQIKKGDNSHDDHREK